MASLGKARARLRKRREPDQALVDLLLVLDERDAQLFAVEPRAQVAEDLAGVAIAIERGGDVVTRVVQMRTKAHIIPHIVKFVKPGSKINTDEGSNFKLLKERLGFDHEMVDHSAKEYVRGDVRTNTMEAFWANVKRGIKGTYVHVSKKHLTSYLREFEYRHNLRRTPYLMFDCLLAAFPKVRVG